MGISPLATTHNKMYGQQNECEWDPSWVLGFTQ
jgi:hypothetical protein